MDTSSEQKVTATLEITVTRADGTVEHLGVVDAEVEEVPRSWRPFADLKAKLTKDGQP